jgi:hypothetical protein
MHLGCDRRDKKENFLSVSLKGFSTAFTFSAKSCDKRESRKSFREKVLLPVSRSRAFFQLSFSRWMNFLKEKKEEIFL